MEFIFALKVLLTPLNDVTTNLQAPPLFRLKHGDKPADFPEKFKERQSGLYPDLRPMPSNLPAKELYARAKSLAERQERWTVVLADETTFHFEIEARTKLREYVDDVVVEVRPENSGSSLHMRSRSRLGTLDFGTNFKRITGFLEQLKPLI